MIHEYMVSAFNRDGLVFRRNISTSLSSVLFIITAAFLLSTSGCQGPVEQVPHIDYNHINTGHIIPPAPPSPWIPPEKIDTPTNVPKSWYPPSSVEKRWTAIIVHHSATDVGNMAVFDREHRSLGWDGVGYDFVIGNGTDSTDGQVEVTFRWKEQKVGAHCKTPDNWANQDGIGICLVGNFNETRPTAKQLDSLVKLTDFLQRRYGISQSRIYGHGATPGAHITDCPGKLFPMAKFKAMLSF